MNTTRKQAKGFTLIEVLAALAVAATGLAAVAKTISSSLDVSMATETRAVANWVAGNYMTELRLSDEWPAAGTSQEDVSMGGRRWRVERTVATTPDDDVVRVTVAVSEDGDGARGVARLNGYLARIQPPRETSQ
jgi:general secretion pathway protein I